MATWLISDQAVPKTDGLKPIVLVPRAKLVHDAALQVIKDTGVVSVLDDEKEEDRKMKQTSTGNDTLVIDLFLTFQDPEFQHQQDLGGIALLKFLRIKGVRNHIVLLSPWSLVELLRMDPGYHVLASEGITIAPYMYTLDELKEEDVQLEKLEPISDEYDLRPWLKAGISLPKDERHNWAQWWGAECLRTMYNARALEENQIHGLETLSAKLKELRCAEMMAVYSYPERNGAGKLINPVITKDIKVLYADDSHTLGWEEILRQILYGKHEDGSDDGSLFAMKPMPGENADQFGSRLQLELLKAHLLQRPFSLVILDLRLVAEAHSVPDMQLSGVKVLRKLKASYPTLPVIIFTATARAELFKLLEKLGALDHWTKPGPEDSGKEGYLNRSFDRLLSVLRKGVRNTGDAIARNITAAEVALEQINRIISFSPTTKQVFVNDLDRYERLVEALDARLPQWKDDAIHVDTCFLLHQDAHEVLPVLHFMALSRLHLRLAPLTIIEHVLVELSNLDRRSAFSAVDYYRRATGRRASMVLPHVTNWLRSGAMKQLRFSQGVHPLGRIADDVFVAEIPLYLRANPASKVLLLSDENEDNARKLAPRIVEELKCDDEKVRFTAQRVSVLKPIASQLREDLSTLSY